MPALAAEISRVKRVLSVCKGVSSYSYTFAGIRGLGCKPQTQLAPPNTNLNQTTDRSDQVRATRHAIRNNPPIKVPSPGFTQVKCMWHASQMLPHAFSTASQGPIHRPRLGHARSNAV